jgi:predicted Na+-dependent transporter
VDALVGTVVPGIVILVMTIVGMELTARDFVRLGERRGPFLASVGGQLVLVPLLRRPSPAGFCSSPPARLPP